MTRPAFRYRKAVEADLSHLTALLPEGLQLDSAIRRGLPMLWQRLLADDAMTFCVVEDLERPYPDGLEAFGVSVFVSDAFADAFCARPRPYFPAVFYERMLADSDVLLSPEGLREANSADGINVAVLHFGLRKDDLSDPRTGEALMAGNAGFYFFHSGYKVRMFINEVYGPRPLRYMEAGGFHLARDFQKASPSDFASMPPEHYPYLFTLKRDQVTPGAVNPLSRMFNPPAPRLGFSRAERQLLERALLNDTDPHIAEATGVSIDAVKKTWSKIFARVAREASFLIPENLPASGTRGQEKRRHLLDYLRMHLEELRPNGAAPNKRRAPRAGSPRRKAGGAEPG